MPRNLQIRPTNLECRDCHSRTPGEARYELVFNPALPDVQRIYLCGRCVAALRQSTGAVRIGTDGAEDREATDGRITG